MLMFIFYKVIWKLRAMPSREFIVLLWHGARTRPHVANIIYAVPLEYCSRPPGKSGRRLVHCTGTRV